MKFDKTVMFSFLAPLMIFISTIGLISNQENKKVFYLPIGLMGIFIIMEKEFSRKLNRQNLLKKIKYYQKSK